MARRKRGSVQNIPTQTRRRSCSKKDRFPSRRDAETSMYRRIRELGARPDAVNVYSCKFGTHWHVGHTPGNLRKR